MHITSGLSTTSNSMRCFFLPTDIRAPGLGRGHPFATRVCSFPISPLLCDIKHPLSTSRDKSTGGRRSRHSIYSWPANPLMSASNPRGIKEPQSCPVRDARHRRNYPAHRTRYHILHILRSLRLFQRRLECKQNLRQKRPQNRLRIAGRLTASSHHCTVALMPCAPGQNGRRLNSMCCLFLNLPSIGVFLWPTNVILWRIMRWRQDR